MAGRKLFLADDSVTIQKVVNLTFADEGIEVLTAGDGDTALHRIADEMPDLVLADVNMPGLNGYELCELLNSDDRTRHIPVILLVGVFEQFDEAEAARVGATAHLTKPFQSIRQLVNQVTDLIESNRAAGEPEESHEPVPYEVPASLVPMDPFEEPVSMQTEPVAEVRASAVDDGNAVPAEYASDREPVAPEAEDIDRLYRQSIGEEPMAPDTEFPDLGVDDEMIETSYTAAQPDGNDLDLLETGSGEPEQDLEDTLPVFYEGWTETLGTSPYETAELDLSEAPSTDTDSAPAAHNDETARLNPAMVEARTAEENRRFEPEEQVPQPAEMPNEPVNQDTAPLDSQFNGRSTAEYEFEFEDIDLLDIPSETEVELTTRAEASGQGGKQVVTLSPDLIEMIAQRVVEKLSERY